ncbi:hypothetical protein ET524_06530 [Senegalimassilia faecalis]|uniref:Uncharacterized protein n=1 Tax=Senegalimassilia faecalis TaxID=2509433 RepID=A0A4Q2JYL5_9ACTN|nr:hypothetical protein [Senegalimassilia faecalis]RXZ54165.1 hypothetical protein ET524_06530 [Senegalimassilia faecalis]
MMDAAQFVLGDAYAQVSKQTERLAADARVLLIARLSVPFTPIRAAPLVVVVGGTLGACILMPKLFCISAFTPGMWWFYGITAIIAAVVFHVFYLKLDAWHLKRMEKLA